MIQSIKHLLIISLIFFSCDTGKLEVVADIPNNLEEASACELMPTSKLVWVIEDAGNNNHIYGLDLKGQIKKDLVVLNSKNQDWEDLTSDGDGNLYIGDFGNNSKKRKQFTIYKISNPEQSEGEVRATKINFELPKGKNSEDFEGFFIYQNSIYIFSKESKNCVMLKVPNSAGNHVAEIAKEFNLEGKQNHITSADISDNGRKVALLNHEKVWILSDYENDDFFGGKIEALPFNYSSQMEGVCFKNNSTLYITNESNGSEGNNIYEFKIN